MVGGVDRELAEHRHALEHAERERGMAARRSPTAMAVERAGLVENAVGYRQLADVVQQAGAIQANGIDAIGARPVVDGQVA